MWLSSMMAQTPYEQGNQYYANGDYAEAVSMYQTCLDMQIDRKSQALVYYNLGNALFKQGELSSAILAYERSLRLDPSNKDTQHNLAFARTRIVDNIEDNQAFFFSTWFKAVRDVTTEVVWRWLSIVLFVVMLACLMLFLLSTTTIVRKTAFHITWISLVLTIFTGLNASSLHSRDKHRAEAIITQGVLNVKSSPDQSGTDLFTLHEGTKVEIKEQLGEWCNIRVGNNEGWMQTNHLERI